ncbi:MAG: hypothetical protein ACFCUE_08835 [Candidatus Bathyarchaeia archaeon]|jgi:beta-lactamase regulating signal transducer with metallopeptidase domain
MLRKSVRAVILIAINIAIVTLSLLLLFYPTSTVSAASTIGSQGFILNEHSAQNNTATVMTIMQDAVFQPILKILTVIGAVSLSYVLLARFFSGTNI